MRHTGGTGWNRGHLEVSTAFLMQGEVSQLRTDACGLLGESSSIRQHQSKGVGFGWQGKSSCVDLQYWVSPRVFQRTWTILWRWLRPASLWTLRTPCPPISVIWSVILTFQCPYSIPQSKLWSNLSPRTDIPESIHSLFAAVWNKSQGRPIWYRTGWGLNFSNILPSL